MPSFPVFWPDQSGPAADEQELLARILANPQDDESRLVYGDCLAERGDPRGELIMLQMKEHRTVKQERRVRQLVREHRVGLRCDDTEAWLGALGVGTLTRLHTLHLHGHGDVDTLMWDRCPTTSNATTTTTTRTGESFDSFCSECRPSGCINSVRRFTPG